jgi:phosphoribosylformylglycinamidine synthase
MTYTRSSPAIKIAKPRVFIPVFPGTNCEYDTARAFERAGAIARTVIFNNLTPENVLQSIEDMRKAISESNILMIPGGFSGGDEPDGSGKFIAAAFKNPYLTEEIHKLLYERDGLALGICNGFQALIKLGLLPFGKITELDTTSPTLTYNTIGRHVSTYVRTKIVSNRSPWLARSQPGDIHVIPVSHGEGRFIASSDMIKALSENGQIATLYVDLENSPVSDTPFNPNGSMAAIEGITALDGRILGKMGHSERMGRDVAANIPGNKDQGIFESGVMYFS